MSVFDDNYSKHVSCALN